MPLRPIFFLFAVLLAAPARAQNPNELTPTTPSDSCANGRISYVFIDNKSIFDTSDPDLDRRLAWAYRTANALHIATKEWVIRRELLFAPGACYDSFLLEETERLLRSYEFLARVDVFGARQPDSTWHVIVSTRDEWSTRVDVRFSSRGKFSLEGIRVTEDNLLGTGQALGAFFFEREVTRDYGIAYFAPQVAGTRWDLDAAAGKTRAGTFFRSVIGYPLIGDVSRWGGRWSFRREDQFFNYIMRDSPDGTSDHLLLPLREKAFDLAVVRRTGRRGNTALVGAALTYQELSYPNRMQIAPEGNFDDRTDAPDSIAAEVLVQRENLDNIRAFALLGQRNVWWVRKRGLDSMRGQEDVRLGTEAVLGIGRSVSALETDDDIYTTMAFYAGVEAGDLLGVLRARTDARRDLGSSVGSEWKDVYVEAEALSYLKSARAAAHTVFLRGALTAGWHTHTPLQLTLGGLYGVRGYDLERFPGGRRLVFSLEDRILLGWPVPDVLDLGATFFVDAGRMWAGDAPFGRDTSWKGGAGLGLRGAFPAGARSTYRIDIAWPLERGTRFSDFRITMSIGEPRGLQPAEGDLQILRSRSQNIGGDLFTFRN